jgi:hypothetical protein
MDRLFDTRKKRTEDIPLHSDEEKIGKHPIGLSESALEKMIKGVGTKKGTLIEADFPYLEQYLHPEHEILPKQELRPTIGTPHDLPYRHAYSDMQMRPDPKEVEDAHTKFGKETIRSIDYTKMKHIPTRIYNTVGLGSYKYDTRNPNYDSIHDVWDFDTKAHMYKSERPEDEPMERTIGPSIDYLVKKFMKNVGKPYAVYERIPKNSEISQ